MHQPFPIQPPRFSLVPWISSSEDLEEGRRFCWEIDQHNDEKLLCLAVKEPFQKRPEAYLFIHATRGNGNDGGVIALALSTTPRFDVYATQSFSLQRGPRG